MTKTICRLNWKRNFLILIFVFNLGMAIGQIPKRDRLDTIAANVPNQYTKDVKKLTEYLVSHCSNDYEKAKIIYSWIGQNIEYDKSSSLRSIYGAEYASPRVLKKKKSQCIGIAMLYESMASAAGLQSQLIIGYAIVSSRSKRFSWYSSATGRGKNRMRYPNHAWNSVLVDGEWILLDATWGLGEIERKERKKRPKSFYSSLWFDMKPEFMALSHFPNDEKWQLLDSIVVAKDFMRFPVVGTNYIERGFHQDTIYDLVRNDPKISLVRMFWTEGVYTASDLPALFELEAKKDYSFTFTSEYYNVVAVKTTKKVYLQVFSGDMVTIDFSAQKGFVDVVFYTSEKDRRGEVVLRYYAR